MVRELLANLRQVELAVVIGVIETGSDYHTVGSRSQRAGTDGRIHLLENLRAAGHGHGAGAGEVPHRKAQLGAGALGVVIGGRAIYAHTFRGIVAVSKVGAGIWIRKDGIAEGY